MKILVYSPALTNRLRYVFQYIFRDRMHCELHLTSSITDLVSYPKVKINYSFERIKRDELFIPSDKLLFESQTIRSGNPEIISDSECVYLFPQPETDSPFRFDPFAAIFYMLSRYEEYQPFVADSLGRFPASSSLSYRNNFLKLPVVDIWIEQIRNKIEEHFSISIPFNKQSFEILPTFDIDHAFAYQNRPLSYVLPRIIKSLVNLKFENAQLIWKAWSKKTTDPFDTYDYILKTLHKFNIRQAGFFILTTNHSKKDDGSFMKNPIFRELITKLESKYTLGIHPSVNSYLSNKKILKEIDLLAKILQNPIQHSRQHYLMLHFPKYYRILIRSGVKHDYSMGFADEIGFRAGTSFAFPWYDLESEQQTVLCIHPFQIMDVTLKKYMNLDPDKAIKECSAIKETIRKYRGEFCFIWHNSSFHRINGWEGWERVFTMLLSPHLVNL